MDLSITALSQLTGMDRRTITERLRELPHKPGPRNGKLYSGREALRLLRGEDGEHLDPSQEKAQLDRERRLLVEMERRQKEGELIPASQVEAAWTGYVATTKSRLMSLPSRLAPEMVRAKTIREAEKVIKVAVIECLEELSGSHE